MSSFLLNGGMVGKTLDFGATEYDRYPYSASAQTDYEEMTRVYAIRSTAANGGNIIQNFTPELKAGDLIISLCSNGSNAARYLTLPAPFQLVTPQLYGNDTNDVTQGLYYRFLDQDYAAGTYSQTATGSAYAYDGGNMISIVIRGADVAQPFESIKTTTLTNSLLVVPPASNASTVPGTFGMAFLSSGDTLGTAQATYTDSVGTTIDYVLPHYGSDTFDSHGMVVMSQTFSNQYPGSAGTVYNWNTWSSLTDGTAYSAVATSLIVRPQKSGARLNSGVWSVSAVQDALGA